MIKILPESEPFFERIAQCAFYILKLVGDAEVELVMMDEDEIHKLNLETRNVDKSTDVLSYPNLNKILPFNKTNYQLDYDEESGCVFLGSIVICEQIARNQAIEYGHSYEREKGYLFLHGLLHLLGYDHIDEKDKIAMRAVEEEVMTKLGVVR